MNYDIREITKEFISQKWPDKSSWFDIAWDIVNKNIPSDDKVTTNLSSTLAMSGLETDEVIEAMLKTMLVFVECFNQIKASVGNDKLGAVFDKSCKKYGLKKGLNEDILQFVNSKAVLQDKQYYKVWSNKTKPEGDLIDKKEYENIINNKSKYDLLVIKDKQHKFFFKGVLDEKLSDVYFESEYYREMIIRICKNGGKTTDEDLLRNVWKDNVINISSLLNNKIKIEKGAGDEVKDAKDKIKQITKKIEKLQSTYSEYLNKHNIHLTRKNDIFGFKENISYCLIEKS